MWLGELEELIIEYHKHINERKVQMDMIGNKKNKKIIKRKFK